MKQHTIGKEATVSGIGLHTGEASIMKFIPAKINEGIIFVRTDIEGAPKIQADVTNVVDTSRGTTLEVDGVRVHTVEHTLAAITGLQIDNILIEISGPEPPIMDGSSSDFVELLEEAGIIEQNALRNYFEITETIIYEDKANNIEIVGLPMDDYRVTALVDYNSPVLGSQHAIMKSINDFPTNIADCRTFVFLHELEALYKQGLVRGGDVDNAIVIVDRVVSENELTDLAKLFNKEKIEVKKEGILNNIELRHKNEPARHKLLDVVGDLTLLGRPIKGQIIAVRPGHAANVAFTKKLKSAIKKSETAVPIYNPKLPPVLDINQISNILPHRFPFLLIDKIIHLDNSTVAGIKNVTLNEPFFQGHFPGNPVMPGVLQVETMAQVGGILALNSVDDPENYWTYFMGIEHFRFKKMVIPGDTLIIKNELLAPIRRGIVKMKGRGFVGNTLVCEGTMTASLVRKEV